MKKFTIITLFIAIIALTFTLYYCNKKSNWFSWIDTPKKEAKINFQAEGNLVYGTPGLRAETWYLIYEQPGQAAQQIQLVFSNNQPELFNGARAVVTGREENDTVKVSNLQILNAYKPNLIRLQSPLPNQEVYSPITLVGEARGSWFFEASFPVKFFDDKGNLLGQTVAQAQGNWMTEDYVQFMASLPFIAPQTETGAIVLQKDNPSGLPEFEDELVVPIVFGTEGRRVKLYFYDSSQDKDSSNNLLCSKQGLVEVIRQIPISDNPIKDTIQLLIAGDITEQEKLQGISTVFPLPGLVLNSAQQTDTTLVLTFQDPENKTSGGSCRVSILRAQLEETAKQFPGVKNVIILPEDIFQP